MFDVIGKRRFFYILSLALTLPGLVFIVLTPFTDAGLQFTIDYTGGTRWEIRFEDPNVTPDQVEEVFEAEGLAATAVRTSTGFIEIKTEGVGLRPAPAPTATPAPSASASPDASAFPDPSASPDASASPAASASPDPSASAGAGASPGVSPVPSAAPGGDTELPTEGRLAEMVEALEADLGPIAQQASLTTIGPVVSSDLIGQALLLIVVGSLAIVAWITYRFRDVKMGITALVSLLHDVVLVVGLFAIFGTFFGVEIDALFVTAMLTVIGFSVHDTIVVYDRIRENRARHVGEPFADIVNQSILKTFGRSVTTSLTVLITLLALFLFGGAAINDFILVLLIGIIAGTYSSIFVASPLLLDWHLYDDRRHGRVAAARAPRTRRVTS
jgi:preprotein translocase SecF subunit